MILDNNRNDIEEIRRRINIADVVGQHVDLKRAGGILKGKCPFHEEKTPSFTVNEEKGFYYCFGCSEGGDIFNFLMQIEGIQFGDALRDLAGRAGIQLRGGQTDKDSVARTDTGKINEIALELFEKNLKSDQGSLAKTYLENRNITDSVIDNFRIGLTLDSFDQLYNKIKNDFPAASIDACGMFNTSKKGKVYDRFRDRIIFPIFDAAGKIVAFGGRIYKEQVTKSDGFTAPKYINSPDTPLYSKSHHLYGLFQAKDAIKRNGYAILVEGYTDVVLPHKYGFQNIVASLGTALTQEQVTLISRYCREIVLAYDPDSAGEKATDRGIVLALEKGLKVKIVRFPGGLDPAEVLEKHDEELFEKTVKEAPEVLDYMINRALERTETATDKAREARSILDALDVVKDTILRDIIVRTVSDRFNISTNVLMNEFKPTEPVVREIKVNISKEIPKTLTPELAVLKMMLEDEKILQVGLNAFETDDFTKPPRREFFEALLESRNTGGDINNVCVGLSNIATKMVAHITNVPLNFRSKKNAFRDLVKTIKLTRIDHDLSDCTESLRDQNLSESAIQELTLRMQNLIKTKHEFSSVTESQEDL